MGDVRKLGKKLVPLLEKTNEVELVDPKTIKAECVVMHGKTKEHFQEFLIAGIQGGTMTTIASMDLPDMALAIDKLQLIFGAAMEQLSPEKRIEISSRIASMRGNNNPLK